MILLEDLSSFRVQKNKLLRAAELALENLGVFSTWHLEIYLIDNREISKLHKRFFKKPGPTTVISIEASKNFVLGNFSGGGEIYLCPGQIRKVFPKSSLVNSLTYCLIHGILHLYGLDHKTVKQERLMAKKESELYDKIKKSVLKKY
jgi:rRNA maturation RNase YbeY